MNNKHWHVADFETTSYRFYEQNGYTKVWLWAICNENAQMEKFGDSIESFMEYCKSLCGDIIYFHNLKFDGKFILYYLVTHGYKYSEDLKVKDARGYSHLITDMDEYFCIKVNYCKSKQVQFNDSLKLLPFKVRDIAIDFELPILKGDWNYEDYTICSESLSYINHDTQVVAMALKVLKENGFNYMTTASSAYHYYTKMYGENAIRAWFPEIEDNFLVEWRQAYRGGRSMVNPRHENKILHNVRRYDINSMYPYIMATKLLPYGYPIAITKPNTYAFELYKVSIEFKLKKGHLPCLLRKQGLYSKVDSYYTETDGIEEIYISNIDLNRVKFNYDILYLSYDEMYGFLTSSCMFDKYVNHFYELKCTSTGSKKICWKLMLNCLYGKFGSNLFGKHKISSLVDDELKFTDSEEERMTAYYLPVAIAITSYAHELIDMAIYETGVENFVYCDTDSIHTLGTLPDSWVDKKELGKFKMEAIEYTSKYVRQKTYITTEEYHEPDEKDLLRDNKPKIEYKDGKYYITNITCAGMDDSMKTRAIDEYKGNIYNIFKTGFKMEGKKMPKNVKGGCVLYETSFEIK